MAYISIYDYQDYKIYVTDWIKLSPNNGRGQRIKLADALGCQTPFITHVLAGNYHFSLEQAEACARWIGLSEIDSEFFVLMVLKQRAASKHAEALFDRQIIKRRNEENALKKRLKIKEGLSPEDQLQYYSQWQYAAVHMALLIPQFQNMESLQTYFQMTRAQILQILEFLSEVKLIEITPTGLRVKNPIIHLEKTSPLLAFHHTNWRLKSIEAIKEKRNDNLHYSSVISLSEDDYQWLKSKISLLLQEVADKIKDSKDEKLGALNFDLFEL